MGVALSRNRLCFGVLVCSAVVHTAWFFKSRTSCDSRAAFLTSSPSIPRILPQPASADIVAVLDLLLPFLGPDVAASMQTVSHEFALSFSVGAIRRMSQTMIWNSFFDGAVRPLVELIQTSAEPSSILRAAALGRYLPRGYIDIWMPDLNGRPPLIKVAGNSHKRPQLLQTLLEAEASPNCIDQYGWTPLKWAAHAGDHHACDILLKAKADVNHVAQGGVSALICATQAPNQLKVFQVLLSAGANAAIVPTQGACADHWEEGALALLFSARRAQNHEQQEALT